jgi:hypothetical protein
VLVDGFGLVPRGSIQAAANVLMWPAKDPSETLDYVFDISPALAGNQGDSIATVDVAIDPNNPGDLALQASSADGDQAILWLTGGVTGTTYDVTITVGTNNGRVIARTVNLPVVTLAVPPGASNAITDQTGAPITTQTASPITTS